MFSADGYTGALFFTLCLAAWLWDRLTEKRAK